MLALRTDTCKISYLKEELRQEEEEGEEEAEELRECIILFEIFLDSLQGTWNG